jgi:hypothetical protein
MLPAGRPNKERGQMTSSVRVYWNVRYRYHTSMKPHSENEVFRNPPFAVPVDSTLNFGHRSRQQPVNSAFASATDLTVPRDFEIRPASLHTNQIRRASKFAVLLPQFEEISPLLCVFVDIVRLKAHKVPIKSLRSEIISGPVRESLSRSDTST